MKTAISFATSPPVSYITTVTKTSKTMHKHIRKKSPTVPTEFSTKVVDIRPDVKAHGWAVYSPESGIVYGTGFTRIDAEADARHNTDDGELVGLVAVPATLAYVRECDAQGEWQPYVWVGESDAVMELSSR